MIQKVLPAENGFDFIKDIGIMPYYKFEKTEVYYEDKGSGKPLFLLHGNVVSTVNIAPDIDFFAQHFRVIAPDYPGLGKSQRIRVFPDDYWQYIAQSVIELADQLGIEHAYAIGTSGGAITALNVATARPGLFTHIIADSFFGDKLSPESARKIRADREHSKKTFLFRQYLIKNNGDDGETILDQDSDMLVRVAEKGLPLIWGDISAIQSKVLLTATSTDELIPNAPAKMQYLLDTIPDCSSAFYDYGRHTFMITERDEFRRVTLNFLGK